MTQYNEISQTIGNTPLVKVNKLYASGSQVYAKLESRNPMASVKDRIGLSMIEAGERDGSINEQTTIVEATSGNTGIALAFVAAAKGYRLILTMPESMSLERRKVLKALGAELVLTPAVQGMKGAVTTAEEIGQSESNTFLTRQFDNPANPQIHRVTTAEEIWKDTQGNIDILVAGVGTGGTITGVSEAIKDKKPSLKTVAVEPSGSPVISQVRAGEEIQPGPHKIQGIGAGFIPKNLNLETIDEVVQVDQQEAFDWARRAASKEGLFVGISSGAALRAADIIASKPENAGKVIVTVIPSFGERYLSTDLFADIN